MVFAMLAHFFQKEPDRLNPEEAALLIGFESKLFIQPRVHPKASLERRNIVLGQMEKNNKITPAQATQIEKAAH